jgi:hypothetical protein
MSFIASQKFRLFLRFEEFSSEWPLVIEGVDESLLSLQVGIRSVDAPLGGSRNNIADNFMTFRNAVLRSEDIKCLSSEILYRKNSSEE